MANSAASVLITETLDNLSRASTTTTRSGATLSSQAMSWLNRTQLEASKATNFVELERLYQSATVDGTKNYSFPVNYKEILTVRCIDGTNSFKLRVMLSHIFDKYFPYPEGDSEDRPNIYVPRGNSFDLYPIPDGIYTVQCRVNLLPTIVTTTADLISFEPSKEDMLVSGMTYRGFRYLQMYEDAAYWKGEYRDLLRQAVLNNEACPDWEPVGHGFDTEQVITGDYWKKPFYFINP